MSSKKLDAAIDALVDALAELPEHELERWQRGNRLGLRILCELGRRYPGIVQERGRFGVSRPEPFGGRRRCCVPRQARGAPATCEFGRHWQRVPSSKREVNYACRWQKPNPAFGGGVINSGPAPPGLRPRRSCPPGVLARPQAAVGPMVASFARRYRPPPSRPFSDHGNEKRVLIRVRRLSSITHVSCRKVIAALGQRLRAAW